MIVYHLNPKRLIPLSKNNIFLKSVILSMSISLSLLPSPFLLFSLFLFLNGIWGFVYGIWEFFDEIWGFFDRRWGFTDGIWGFFDEIWPVKFFQNLLSFLLQTLVFDSSFSGIKFELLSFYLIYFTFGFELWCPKCSIL